MNGIVEAKDDILRGPSWVKFAPLLGGALLLHLYRLVGIQVLVHLHVSLPPAEAHRGSQCSARLFLIITKHSP